MKSLLLLSLCAKIVTATLFTSVFIPPGPIISFSSYLTTPSNGMSPNTTSGSQSIYTAVQLTNSVVMSQVLVANRPVGTEWELGPTWCCEWVVPPSYWKSGKYPEDALSGGGKMLMSDVARMAKTGWRLRCWWRTCLVSTRARVCFLALYLYSWLYCLLDVLIWSIVNPGTVVYSSQSLNVSDNNWNIVWKDAGGSGGDPIPDGQISLPSYQSRESLLSYDSPRTSEVVKLDADSLR